MNDLSGAINSNFLHRRLNRGDLGLLVLASFFIAVQPPLADVASIGSIVDALARQNLFLCFALFVAGRRFLQSSTDLSLSRSDWIVAGATCLLFGVSCFFGVDQVAGLVLTIILIPIYFFGKRDENFNSALLVCVALAINSFWGPLIFQTFTGPIIAVDTHLLKWVYAVLRPDIVSDGTMFKVPGQFGIIVVGICSVFNSASIAFLACAAFAQQLKPGVRLRDVVVLVFTLAAMIAINTGRLALMGWGRGYFEFWHNGEGNTVVAVFQTVVIALVAFVGARWAAKAGH